MYKLKGIKVLIVEDDEVNIFMLKRILSSWNMDIDIAMDGKAALEKISSKNFSIILLDLYLPIIDGKEVIKKIRSLKDPYFSQLPIIVITSHINSEIENQIMSLGVNDMELKPVDSIRLNEKIHVLTKDIKHNTNVQFKKIEKPIIDVKFQKVLKQSKNNIEYYIDILSLIKKNFKDFETKLKEVETTHNKGQFHFIVHKAKSSLNLLGEKVLYEKFKILENSIDNYNIGEIINEESSGMMTNFQSIISEIDTELFAIQENQKNNKS